MEKGLVSFNGFKGVPNSEEIPQNTEMFKNTKTISATTTPRKLPGEVEKILNERIGDEYKAYFFYRNAANWCKGANYKKAASFFESEASNELEHSKGLQDYLTQWNLYPIIPQAETTHNFTNLLDIISQAYELEYNLLEKYSGDQKSICEIHPATFNFIQKYVDIQNKEVEEYSDLLNPATFNFIQKYVDIQNKEVEEYSDLLNAIELINPENKLDVLYFENNYFG